MPGAHEKLERAEHATHAGGHGGDSNRLFGVTMALIGVLIAVCSAKVGSERNEFTRAMIKQTQAHAKETSASTKLRLVNSKSSRPGKWPPVTRKEAGRRSKHLSN